MGLACLLTLATYVLLETIIRRKEAIGMGDWILGIHSILVVSYPPLEGQSALGSSVSLDRWVS